MAERSDISFDRFNKIVTIDAPSTAVTIQDLYDTIRDWEDEPSQMDLASVCVAGGKESLGAGEFTGITLTLINDWRLAFESRPVAVSEGTETAGSDGTTLTDGTATFETDGVQTGDLVANYTDGAHGTIIDVVSETVLTIRGLAGGTDNDFDIGDSYGVFEVESCVVSGGNLVAINAFGNNPILPTFGTQVQLRQSAAPVQIIQSNTRSSSFIFSQ